MKNKSDESKKFSVKEIYCTFLLIYFIITIIFTIIDVPNIVVCLIFLIISVIFISLIRKQLIEFIDELEMVLENMIDGNDIGEEKFIYRDNLFSKIVYKLWKMNNTQQHMKTLLEKERNQIEKMVSDIAHQVKTPMTNGKMYHEILLNQLKNEEQYKEVICIIQSQVNKLDFLLQSILKISELEIGIIDLKRETSSLRMCLMKALENVLLYAKRKNIEINVHDKMDLEVFCDMKWTAEALFNILDNAIKYTDENGKIDIFSQSIGIYSCICIQDNGIGIDAKNLTNIFKRFYREKNDIHIDGVGIGLSITREIIMKQGGYITVQSEKNKGSKFLVYLPKNEFFVRSNNGEM